MWKIFFYLRFKKFFYEFRFSVLGIFVVIWFNYFVFLLLFINENIGEEGCDDILFMFMMFKNVDIM